MLIIKKNDRILIFIKSVNGRLFSWQTKLQDTYYVQLVKLKAKSKSFLFRVFFISSLSFFVKYDKLLLKTNIFVLSPIYLQMIDFPRQYVGVLFLYLNQSTWMHNNKPNIYFKITQKYKPNHIVETYFIDWNLGIDILLNFHAQLLGSKVKGKNSKILT